MVQAMIDLTNDESMTELLCKTEKNKSVKTKRPRDEPLTSTPQPKKVKNETVIETPVAKFKQVKCFGVEKTLKQEAEYRLGTDMSSTFLEVYHLNNDGRSLLFVLRRYSKDEPYGIMKEIILTATQTKRLAESLNILSEMVQKLSTARPLSLGNRVFTKSFGNGLVDIRFYARISDEAMDGYKAIPTKIGIALNDQQLNCLVSLDLLKKYPILKEISRCPNLNAHDVSHHNISDELQCTYCCEDMMFD